MICGQLRGRVGWSHLAELASKMRRNQWAMVRWRVLGRNVVETCIDVPPWWADRDASHGAAVDERFHRHRTPPRQCPWILWVRSSDNVLSSWPYQLSHFYNFWSCWARKMEGTELSPSCTQHTASPCAWYQHTSVNGMSSLQVSGTLRSRVTQRSEHMLRGRWVSSWPTARVNTWSIFTGTYGNAMTASKHIFWFRSLWQGVSYPLEILVLGSLTHKSPRCLQVGNGYGDIINGCASSILGSQELLLGQRLTVWTGPSFGVCGSW